ncbi:MAG: hypothetical protein QOK29_335 [Rhodospirillaceae bacterium]|jgi:hypothetical protein|nr:hypothetical protein [Rhodospirillaceae bacterium]
MSHRNFPSGNRIMPIVRIEQVVFGRVGMGPGRWRLLLRKLVLGLLLATFPAAAYPAGSTVDTPAAPATPKTQPGTPPAPATPPKQASPPANPPAPKSLESVAPTGATALLGRKVQGPNGEDMGMVVDVVVDGEGRPRALVIDFGGFLGVGSRKIAIDWRLVHFRPSNHDAPVMLRLGRAEVQAAPEYDPNAPAAKMVGPPATDIPASTDVGK